MNVIFENLYKDYEGKIVFSSISGRINNNEKIGLIGVNGIGKTTLAKLLAGLEQYEEGSIKYSPSNLKIHYMNEALEGKDFSNLSGGEKTKQLLSETLNKDYDVLILDEPTNHLDMESVSWLEGIIKNLRKTVLIISHDRYFLDKTTNKIWELSSKELRQYEGNYTSYKLQKKSEIRNQLKEYEKQQRDIKHLNEVINDRKDWFDKAHKAAGQNDFARSKAKKHVSVMRAKEKQLERLEDNKVEKPKEEVAACFELLNKGIVNTKLSRYLVQGNNLYKSYGDRTILTKASFSIMRGDKIALLGNNGAGKTTIIKMLNGLDKNFDGIITVNPSVKIGYFAQELENLNYDKCILDNLLESGATQKEARLLLACLLFKGDDVFKEVKNLSMGEKCRVAFAKLILSSANLLILDEPTNYMDIVSKEKVEEILEEFQGSMLFVSHDRYFVNRLSNKVLQLNNYKLTTYLGGYEEYLNKIENDRKAEALSEDYNTIKDTISRLECELAFISGRLNDKLTEEERQIVNDKFLLTAREINMYKNKIKA
ncbi:ATP-binding cassette domain-containing protein [Clostridium swellfunianum]|uniref:ribosomal protection-like ABC-F family protein n=1 Tax=Clostridium swellfunianum TaxID=1367462 RepID=UPI002030698E|nr:ABC-F family ATP-binding cassette domain-containing protein [Clostridium swellfunianum]MCM0650839.1 ATP-binding cassette domain-containing protein [Clostridium swellfunianum]